MPVNFPSSEEMPEGLERHAAHASRAVKGSKKSVEYFMQHRDPKLNDALIAYLMHVQSTFDLLRDTASQTAAILVMIASGSAAAAAHPMLSVAQESEREVRERLSGLRVPAEGRHGHAHLSDAVDALRAALTSMRASGSGRVAQHTREIAGIYDRLQDSLRELRYAAGCLPGLELIAASEACACHARFQSGES